MNSDRVENLNENENKNFDLALTVNKFEYHLRNQLLDNVPKNHKDVRVKILDDAYMLLSDIYFAIYNKGNIRSKYLCDALVHICLIDHFLKTLLELKCVNIKKYENIARELSQIRSRIFGWKKKTDDEIELKRANR